MRLKIKSKIFLSFLLISLMYIFTFSASYGYLSEIGRLSMEIEPLSYEIQVIQEQIESSNTLETTITSYAILQSKELEEALSGYVGRTSENIKDFEENDKAELLRLLSELDENIGSLIDFIKQEVNSSELNYKILNTYAALENVKGEEKEILRNYTQELHDIIDVQKRITVLLIMLFTGSGISILILAFVMSFILGKKITGPLSQLEKIMREGSEGKLDTEVEIRSQDEIGSLASSFNNMRKGIKKYQKRLQEYGSMLEKKVKERTMELEASKKQLEDKNINLERFNRLAVGRELKMVELKKRIKELEAGR